MTEKEKFMLNGMLNGKVAAPVKKTELTAGGSVALTT
jgi:hypothetical protein